jgi:hypothetical protein
MINTQHGNFTSMKKILIATPLVIFVMLMQQTSFAQAPVISSFSPASGAVGSIVTITGMGFSEIFGQNIVFFGATQATVTSASATSLSVTVPVGATYQYLSVTNLAVNLTAYSAQPFKVTLAGGLAFEGKKDFETIAFPYSVRIGDIDGDGKPDLVVMNPFSTTVSSVLRNTSSSGTVSFSARVDFTTGTQPRSVSIGDIDGDGKQDLAVANAVSNTVSVLRNISTPGTISISAKVDFTTGTSPRSVGIGDLDGDGKPDLVVGNGNDNTVSILRNISMPGTIILSNKVDFTTGNGPGALTIGDIDGDGKPDLAVACYGSNIVSVLRNTSTNSGNISFDAKVDLPTGIGPQALSIGDIDGDGKPDLASANFENNNLWVLRNTSTSGIISFSAKVDFSAGTSRFSANIGGIDIGDIDGDGKPDIAVASLSSNTVSILRNTSTSGNVSFDAKVDLMTDNSPSSVSIGDIDGDGKPDLVASSLSSSGSVSVIRQLGQTPITGNIEQLTGSEISALYPNPIKNQLEIRLNGFDSNSHVIIIIIDGRGRKILESMEMAGKEIRLDVDHITSGYYFVRLVQGEKTQQFRFVKN